MAGVFPIVSPTLSLQRCCLLFHRQLFRTCGFVRTSEMKTKKGIYGLSPPLPQQPQLGPAGPQVFARSLCVLGQHHGRTQTLPQQDGRALLLRHAFLMALAASSGYLSHGRILFTGQFQDSVSSDCVRPNPLYPVLPFTLNIQFHPLHHRQECDILCFSWSRRNAASTPARRSDLLRAAHRALSPSHHRVAVALAEHSDQRSLWCRGAPHEPRGMWQGCLPRHAREGPRGRSRKSKGLREACIC